MSLVDTPRFRGPFGDAIPCESSRMFDDQESQLGDSWRSDTYIWRCGIKRKCVGVFWDIESFTLPHDVEITEFGGALVSYARTFTSENDGCETSLLCVSQPSRAALGGLQELGYEVITKHHGGDTHSLGVQMLLWLWDQEREASKSEGSTKEIFVIAVCGKSSFTYLDEITSRGISVILVSDLSEETEQMYAEFIARCTTSMHYATILDQSRPHRSVSFLTDNDADATPLAAQREDSFNFSGLDMGGGPFDAVGRLSHSNSPFSLLMSHEDPPVRSSFDDYRSNIVSGRAGAIGAPINAEYAHHHLQPQTSLESQGSAGSGGFIPSIPPHQLHDYRIGGVGGPMDNFILPFYEAATRDVIGESIISTPEQRDLFTNLKYAFSKWNVKNAVSLLRKIYSKQTKYFKISSLIAASTPNINQLFETNENLAITVINFLLSCVQWCMGVQGSGNASESFKYKMNRNISRWLLKELQRQAVPPVPHPEVESHAIAVANHILRNMTEFDFALDILVVIGVRDPYAIIRPFIEYSNRNPDPVLAVKVTEFVLKHPDIHERRSNSANMPHLGAMSPSFEMRSAGTRDRLLSDDSDMRSMYTRMPDAALPSSYFAPQKMQYKEDDTVLVGRLIRLLQKSGGGALGARIPTLYREEYGEPLNLRGRKLKDILTETNLVELIGADGPGDKLFKLIVSPAAPGSSMRRSNTDNNFFQFERTMRDGIDPVRSKSGDEPLMKFW